MRQHSKARVRFVYVKGSGLVALALFFLWWRGRGNGVEYEVVTVSSLVSLKRDGKDHIITALIARPVATYFAGTAGNALGE